MGAAVFVEGHEPDAHARRDGRGAGRVRSNSIHANFSSAAREHGRHRRGARWPMIVLASPKGWTGPKVDRRQDRSKARSVRTRCRCRIRARPIPSTCSMLEEWLRSYRPARTVPRATAASRRRSPPSRPSGARRMGASPHANGGLLLRELHVPDFREYAVDVASAGHRQGIGRHPRARASSSATSSKLNERARSNFRLFGPDETLVQRPRGGVRRRRSASGKPRSRVDDDEFLARDRPRDGGAQRAPVRRLAGGLPAHRPPRPASTATRRSSTSSTRCSTSTRSGSRSPRKVAVAARSIASLNYPAVLARLAPGSQRLHAPGSRLHRPRDEQESRRSCASICRPTPTACCR